MTRRIACMGGLAGLVLPGLLGCMRPQGPTMPHRATSHLARPAPLDIVGVGEADLVEELALHRQQYHQLLRTLSEFYLEHGHTEKARQASRELAGLNRVSWYNYLAGAEIPAQREMKPTQSIPEADALYEDGLGHLKAGGHGIPVFFNEDRMKLAMDRFLKLIREYPTSDKIDDAAFYCGEIYKEYFNDNEHAVQYYEAAVRWDPATPHNARFQAAVVYDYRMHDRDRALELYRDVLENERTDGTNVTFAARRIRQLTDPRRRGALTPALPEPDRSTSAIPAAAVEDNGAPSDRSP